MRGFYEQTTNTCSIIVSYNCISNLQCLTNKYVDGVCIFTNDNPTEFYTDIYGIFVHIFYRHLYIYCSNAICDNTNII